MKASFCVVLPVRNVESTLVSVAASVLDAAEQTGARFEVLIVDNGSQDDTWDTACDLGRMFPQISAIRFSIQIGLGHVLQSAKNQSQAEWICLHRGTGTIVADEIIVLWRDHISKGASQRKHSFLKAALGFQLLPHSPGGRRTSTPKLASRIALIERAARKGLSRQLRRQLLCGVAISEHDLAK